ncbi:hypothetical protein [Macrococcoides caseolyticum]|uniref:hypothetical protein n=1 Tax=Macrococcoides caseolyticum TaxID=69966 RepID=UPI002F3E2361
MNDKIKGILWLVAASVGFSLMGAFVKLSGDLLSYLGYIIIFFASYYIFVKAKVKQIQ